MKLSTAIRRGIKKDGKQHFGDLYKFEFEDDNEEKQVLVACCALGAAIIGAKGVKWVTENPDADPIHELFPRLEGVRVTPPGQKYAWDIFDAVIELNDERKWSREKIAAWLARKGY